SGCNDTVTCEQGASCPPVPPAPPVDSAKLSFVQGDQTWPLATAHPDQSYEFSETVSVPSAATKGSATVRTGDATAAFDVTEGPQRLARTGFSPASALVVSALLAAIGALVLRLRRRVQPLV